MRATQAFNGLTIVAKLSSYMFARVLIMPLPRDMASQILQEKMHSKERFLEKFNPIMPSIHKNGQTHVKNLAAAGFLTYF